MVNSCQLLGNLGADPEVRFTQSGAAICNFRMATSFKNAGGVETTEWHNVVVFGKQAEPCGKYLSKGRQAYVDGRIQYRNYDDKDGNKRFITEIIANRVVFVGGGKDSGPSTAPIQSTATPPDDSDDIPF